MLTIVPTPIGNLSDITLRAIEVLKDVDLILCEDTRVTKKLLSKYGIVTRLQSFHKFNEHKSLQRIIKTLGTGIQAALVSDAGTPGISDPGYLLIRECINADIEVTCLPGPTAFVPALVLSGMPIDKFHFEGFLPRKKGRKTRLLYLAALKNTFILYESPFRIIKTLHQLKEHCGENRNVSLVRELSKIYEECLRGTLSDLISTLESRASIKGEIVLVVAGST